MTDSSAGDKSTANSGLEQLDGRVLLVEPGAACRAAMKRTLTSICSDVIEAEDGEAAIALARAEQPDLILLAVEMAGVDGFELCRLLKADELTESIPVLLLRDEGNADQAKRAFEIGALGFIRKSSHEVEIVTRVRMHLSMGLLQKRLRQSEALHRAIVDTVVAGIVTVDAEGVVHSFNQAAERIFGYDSSEVVGMSVLDFLPGSLAASYAAPIQNIVTNADSEVLGRHVEIDGVRKDGSIFPMEVYLSEVGIEKNNLYACIVHDTTARKRAEEKIEQQREHQLLINSLLRIQLEGGALQSQLDRAIAVVLQSRWLGSEAQGGVFLIEEDDPETLHLTVRKRLSPLVINNCSQLKMGECLCGMAAESGEMQHAWSLDERHTERCKAVDKHGHYNVPIKSGETALGVIVLILPEGVEQHDSQIRFLESVSDIMAGMIERHRSEQQLETLNRELLETSRQAGMAMIANNVLHNVGNVLNSVNVSADVVGEKIRGSKAAGVGKVAGLLASHADDLGSFLTADPKGKMIPGYLADLAEHLDAEREELLSELSQLSGRIDHIKQIVSMQQSYAGKSGILERVSVAELLDDAVRMNEASFIRHEIEIVREYEELPLILTDKHKLLQIMINLVQNARHAMCDHEREGSAKLVLRARRHGENEVSIEVEDNGIGIEKKNISKVFASGFTTKKEGKGFGLHSSALAASEMNGSLSAASDGRGRGASFTIRLPLGTNHERSAA